MIRNAGYGASSTLKIGRQTKGPGSQRDGRIEPLPSKLDVDLDRPFMGEIGNSTYLRDCRTENVGSADPCARGLYALMSTIADLRLRGHRPLPRVTLTCRAVLVTLAVARYHSSKDLRRAISQFVSTA